LTGSHALGKADERTRQALADVVRREALDAVGEFPRALYEDLHQSHGEPRPFHDDILDFGGAPGHQLGAFQGHGLFRAGNGADERGLAEELVRLVNIYDHLTAVVSQPRNLDLPPDHQIDGGGRLVLVVDRLPPAVLDDTRTRQVR